MRLFVHHHDAGRIRSATVFDAPPNAGMMLVPAQGERVTEIEGHRLKSVRGSEQSVRRLIRASVVAAPVARSTLVARKRR